MQLSPDDPRWSQRNPIEWKLKFSFWCCFWSDMPRPAQPSTDHNIGNGQILGLSASRIIPDNPRCCQHMSAHVSWGRRGFSLGLGTRPLFLSYDRSKLISTPWVMSHFSCPSLAPRSYMTCARKVSHGSWWAITYGGGMVYDSPVDHVMYTIGSVIQFWS